MLLLNQQKMHNKRGEKRMNKTINDEIQTQINNTIKQQPYPTTGTITKIYQNGYTDITTETYGNLTYIPTIGNPEIGYTAVLLFLDNDYSKRIVITSTKIPTE